MFDDWHTLLRTVAVGFAAYAALILWLRLSGKRTMSKWNAFDMVVTIAIGSMLATTTLSSDTTLVQGVAAFALFVLLQFAITWSSVRAPWVSRVLKGTPRLLLVDGEPLREALREERVTEGELRAAVRASGLGTLERAAAVVLETDGSFSVVRRESLGDGSALTDVARRGPGGPSPSR